MAFWERRFDERLSFGARGGPVWKTTKVVTQSGRRAVNREWTYPLHRYQVAHAIKTEDDFETVRAFFFNAYGSFDGFRFKDWADYELTKANSRLTAIAGSPSLWQLNRVYTAGAREFLRPIYKPVASPVVYRTRSSVESVASAVTDTTDGTVVISGHQSGDTYTSVGEFDVPVAFADDNLEAEIVDRGGDGFMMHWSSIELEEIRL